ncbi:uncharacterized protein EV420DRAFT_1485873 [Desarmillaria tabescens]|uniref:Uncharacterized protein n=1 Tax=Armillaria tabescens TaxID=1929756 RepID=A0AA39JG13_ARMTA|nr:uncharacterized protein EV420DRAFT_1485873 [Desarmillaria tabescens]KAK0440664.1 hypothetical protein EV420DRAFT_1485873 [Desarmillaria tabescens]
MAKTYKRKREQRRPEERDEREQTQLEKREEGRGRRIRMHRNDASPSRSAIFPDHEPIGSEEDFNEQTYVGSSTSGTSDGACPSSSLPGQVFIAVLCSFHGTPAVILVSIKEERGTPDPALTADALQNIAFFIS